MALITPQSTIYLIKGVPWQNNYVHTRLFSSAAEQQSYFMGKQNIAMENATYARITGRDFIAWNGNADNLDGYNYLAIKNIGFTDKWFYAFVSYVEYLNTETARVYFEIDVMQTFMFDYTLQECMIERSHVGVQSTSNLWVAQEKVDYGTEYETIASVGYDVITASNSLLLITSTIDLTKDFGDFINPNLTGAMGCYVDELPSGCDYYVVGGDYGDNIDAVFTALQDFPWISKGIIGLTVLPTQMLNSATISTVHMGDGSTIIGKLNGNTANSRKVAEVGVFEPFAQREPDFVKFYGFPYSYIEVTCFNGSVLVVAPQYTKNNKVTIWCDSVISSSPEMKYYFSDYLNDGYDRSITLADFPEMPVQDSNYMMVRRRREAIVSGIGQKVDNAGANILSRAVELWDKYIGSSREGMGANTVYIGESGADIANNILNTINPEVGAPTVQNQAGGTTFNYVHGKMGVTVKWKMIGAAYRNMIRDYWKRFGYEINLLKTPNLTSMSRYNYIKTKGCTITGNIDSIYYQAINQIYNAGITFWHDDNIGNYSNNIPLSSAYN